MTLTLLELQNLVKRDPVAYETEFVQVCCICLLI